MLRISHVKHISEHMNEACICELTHFYMTIIIQFSHQVHSQCVGSTGHNIARLGKNAMKVVLPVGILSVNFNSCTMLKAS